nr:hypothetical protein [Bacteroidota bacterium]
MKTTFYNKALPIPVNTFKIPSKTTRIGQLIPNVFSQYVNRYQELFAGIPAVNLFSAIGSYSLTKPDCLPSLDNLYHELKGSGLVNRIATALLFARRKLRVFNSHISALAQTRGREFYNAIDDFVSFDFEEHEPPFHDDRKWSERNSLMLRANEGLSKFRYGIPEIGRKMMYGVERLLLSINAAVPITTGQADIFIPELIILNPELISGSETSHVDQVNEDVSQPANTIRTSILRIIDVCNRKIKRSQAMFKIQLSKPIKFEKRYFYPSNSRILAGNAATDLLFPIKPYYPYDIYPWLGPGHF